MKYITQKKAAEIIGCSVMTVRNYAGNGKLKRKKQNGRIYFNLDEVNEVAKNFAEKKEVKQVDEEPREVSNSNDDTRELDKYLAEMVDNDYQIKRISELKKRSILDKEPPKSWVKQLGTELNAQGKPVMYLPIDRVEYLLTNIYTWFEWQIKDVKQLFRNTVVVTVTLSYRDLDGELRTVDGVGATQIANEATSQRDVPRAEALARMNAAKKLGKIFGRDINREMVEVEPREQGKAIKNNIIERINAAKNSMELEALQGEVKKIGCEVVNQAYNDREFMLN